MASPIIFTPWPSTLTPGYGPYRAVIEKIVDGDTIYIQVSLGLDVYAYHSIRLHGIDSPELFTSDPIEREKGRAARSYLESIAPVGTKCLLVTDRDKTTFGRYIGSVTLEDGSSLATLMVESGMAKWSS